jgi:hypothetical protein
MHIFAGFFRTQNCFDKLATQCEGGQQTVLNVYLNMFCVTIFQEFNIGF